MSDRGAAQVWPVSLKDPKREADPSLHSYVTDERAVSVLFAYLGQHEKCPDCRTTPSLSVAICHSCRCSPPAVRVRASARDLGKWASPGRREREVEKCQ